MAKPKLTTAQISNWREALGAAGLFLTDDDIQNLRNSIQSRIEEEYLKELGGDEQN